MSSSDAQRSPVHHATEDSSREPSGMGQANSRETPGRTDPREDAAGGAGGFERGAAMAGVRPDGDDDGAAPGQIGGGPGAGDGSSGGGAGAGIPGGGTDMRTNGAFSGGDAEEDRKRLFPDSQTGRTGEEADPNDPDESSFGGPLQLNDPDLPAGR